MTNRKCPAGRSLSVFSKFSDFFTSVCLRCVVGTDAPRSNVGGRGGGHVAMWPRDSIWHGGSWSGCAWHESDLRRNDGGDVAMWRCYSALQGLAHRQAPAWKGGQVAR